MLDSDIYSEGRFINLCNLILLIAKMYVKCFFK